MRKRTIDHKDIAATNEQLVISLLRKHGAMSQAQLRKMAALSSSTTSYIIARLRTKQLITETQGQSKKRGAKPILVQIDPVGRYAVGIEINPNTLILGLFDFTAKLIEKIYAPLAADHSPDIVCNAIEINLRGLLAKHNIDTEKLSGIGVALSGSITPDGTIELSSPLGWKSVPLKKLLQQRLPAPVTLCTTRVRLLAEMEIEPDASYNNVLYLNIADGVGSHIIIDGHLIHGSTNRSGEIGHIVVDPNGPTCGCGHKGCLEALISGPALAHKITEDIAKGKQTLLKDTVTSSDTVQEIITKWADALNANDPYAIELKNFLTAHFSSAAAAIINCYDPEIIILAGYVSKHCFDALADSIRQRIQTEVYDSETRNIKIKPAKAANEALITGAAITVLQNITTP